MTRLVLALTRADLRTAPERAVTVALLLTAAALLPPALGLRPTIGVVLAIGVAGAAAAGATVQHRRRHEVMFLNGAATGIEARLAAAAMVVPGLAAAGVSSIIGLLRDGPPHPPDAVALTLVVPVVVAPVVTLLWSPIPRHRRRTVSLVIVVVLLTPTVIVPLGVLAFLVGRRLTRAGAIGRTIGAVVAVVVAVGTSVLAGRSESWFDLSIILTLSALPLGLAIAWLSSTALGGSGWLAHRLGPLARLAVTPLAERRAVLAPVMAVVAMMTSLAALEAVMGASFGAREAARDKDGVVLGQVGTGPDQAVVVTSVDLPAWQVRDLAVGAAHDAGLAVAVIDRLGPGGTEVHGSGRPQAQFPLGITLEVPPTWRLAGIAPPAPSWIGVATPEDLDVLGLGSVADALARGDAVVLVEGGVADGRVQLRGPGGSHELRATTAGPPGQPAILLPAALISPARAADLGAEVHSGRAVFAPGDAPIDDDALVEVASRFGEVLRLIAPGNSDPGADGSYDQTWDEIDLVAMESGHPPALGNQVVRSDPGGPLNRVPYMSGTWEAGRGQALALGALAVLVALAGTVLALGTSRADDAALDAQGGSTRVRAMMAAVQAAVLTGTAAVVAAAVGIGLPAIGFADYNARPRVSPTIDIPLVVPWELLAGLAALPLLAAVLAAVVTALRRPVPVSDLDDLVW